MTKRDNGYDVGGVRMERPFHIRRLGHFGFHVDNVDACHSFYHDLLGFETSDVLPIAKARGLSEKDVGAGNMLVYFLRHGTDHHSFALFPMKTVKLAQGIGEGHLDSINQISWQLGSLREVVEADEYLAETINPGRRRGRDMPGSNYHIYSFDPDGTTNEILYGMEQIGWDGYSKPLPMYERRITDEVASLPQINEFVEVEDAIAKGVDLASGFRKGNGAEAKYDVGGIMLPRPFKVVDTGPVRLFVEDFEQSMAYYCGKLGFRLTEEITWQGHRCALLGTNTDHHSLGLYPIEMRGELGLSGHTRCLSYGLQVAEYSQLRDAVSFLEENGVTIKYLPPELTPGIDYSAYAIDPDGHAIELYYYMEQVGWDGRPRPADQRPKVDNANWPELADQAPDTYGGRAYLGPWG